MVRRRGRVRVLAAVGAIAAVALIAATVVWWRLPGEPKASDKECVVEKQPPPPPPLVVAQMPAVALEWQAFDAPREQKSTLYRQAGDRYVQDADDLASAVRCYGQAIRAASAEDLEFDRDDNLLVMALKMDEIERRKEK